MTNLPKKHDRWDYNKRGCQRSQETKFNSKRLQNLIKLLSRVAEFALSFRCSVPLNESIQRLTKNSKMFSAFSKYRFQWRQRRRLLKIRRLMRIILSHKDPNHLADKLNYGDKIPLEKILAISFYDGFTRGRELTESTDIENILQHELERLGEAQSLRKKSPFHESPTEKLKAAFNSLGVFAALIRNPYFLVDYDPRQKQFRLRINILPLLDEITRLVEGRGHRKYFQAALDEILQRYVINKGMHNAESISVAQLLYLLTCIQQVLASWKGFSLRQLSRGIMKLDRRKNKLEAMYSS